MRAGQLRHTISIQEQTDVADGMGGFTTSWADISGMDAIPAAIWPLSAKESIEAMKLELVVSHKIRIRYRSGITAKNRILFGSRVFDVVSLINNDERNISLDMLAVEDT
ncbi:MAG: phage head closure protein [candidate division Zixibacteria bacterium]|nr:phage head closure protein [candidate division Zixibacteria bacterium]